MPTLSPFTPGASKTITAAATATTTTFPAGNGNVLRLANVSAVEAFVVLGSSSAVANNTGTSMSLPANSVTYLSIDNSTQTNAAFKALSSSVKVRITRGDGFGG